MDVLNQFSIEEITWWQYFHFQLIAVVSNCSCSQKKERISVGTVLFPQQSLRTPKKKCHRPHHFHLSTYRPTHTNRTGWRSVFLCFGLVWAALLTGFSPSSHYAALMRPLTLWSEFPTPQPCCLRTVCTYLRGFAWICVRLCVPLCVCVCVCCTGLRTKQHSDHTSIEASACIALVSGR